MCTPFVLTGSFEGVWVACMESLPERSAIGTPLVSNAGSTTDLQSFQMVEGCESRTAPTQRAPGFTADCAAGCANGAGAWPNAVRSVHQPSPVGLTSGLRAAADTRDLARHAARIDSLPPPGALCRLRARIARTTHRFPGLRRPHQPRAFGARGLA